MIIAAMACILLSFFISYLAAYYILKYADKLRIGKRVYSERVKLHKKGVPRLGGIAIYAAISGTLLAFYLFERYYFYGSGKRLAGILLASLVVMICGFYDDNIKRLGYKIKFASQILASFILVVFGHNINVISNPFGNPIQLGIFGIPVFILWMLVIMNAINLIDGLDGLACGVTAIVCFGFSLVAFFRGDFFSFLIVLSVIGACLAFLRYNIYPARLFLGDSGSLFLGLMLGALAIENSIKRATAISMAVPLLALFVPVASVVFTFSRRVAKAENPFKPDRWHMHYRLLRAGISHRDVVLIFYTVTILYTIMGIFCFFIPKEYEVAVIAFAGVTAWILYMWALYFINKKKKSKRMRNK